MIFTSCVTVKLMREVAPGFVRVRIHHEGIPHELNGSQGNGSRFEEILEPDPRYTRKSPIEKLILRVTSEILHTSVRVARFVI